MAYKGNDKCIKNAFDDEKLFVLMARDNTAPQVIIEWIKLNLDKQPIEKLTEALECAVHMQLTCNDINLRKSSSSLPGFPVSTLTEDVIPFLKNYSQVRLINIRGSAYDQKATGVVYVGKENKWGVKITSGLEKGMHLPLSIWENIVIIPSDINPA